MNADQTKIIEGSKLMLFINNKSIAMATNHTLSLSAETTEISNKDIGSGDWTANNVRRFSWEVSTENMFTVSAYKKLFQLMLAKQPVDAVFSIRKGDALIADSSSYFADWTWKYTNASDSLSIPDKEYYTGKVIITSLDVQAPNDDNATFSCTMTGTGSLTYYTNILEPEPGDPIPDPEPADPANP